MCGRMHGVAPKPTRHRNWSNHNKILTWGVNDNGALGRNTEWEGSISGLNPSEASPGEVDWSEADLPENTKFTHVAAGDSCSFVVTDDG